MPRYIPCIISYAWDVYQATDDTFQGTPKNWKELKQDDTNMKSLAFKSDGTKMYTVGSTKDNVYQYKLTTAWDVATAELEKTFYVGNKDNTPTSIAFKPDGSKMYVLGFSNLKIYQYTLTANWDIGSASFDQDESLGSGSGQLYPIASPRRMYFKPDDGTKLYIVNNNTYAVIRYTLSVGWDISTASSDQSLNVINADVSPSGVFFFTDGTSNDGTILYVIGTGYNQVRQYNLSTGWDLSTASGPSNYFNAKVIRATSANTVYFKPDGSRLYVVFGNAFNAVYQYDLPVGSYWNQSQASFTYPTTDYKDVSNVTTSVEGLYFDPTGQTLFVLDGGSRNVYEYSLSTAWVLETAGANPVNTFYIGNQEGNPQAIAFGDSGSKMYIVGTITDTVYQYTLPNAWSLTNASYSSKSAATPQAAIATGLDFSANGDKMFVKDFNSGLQEYTLQTNWDVSSASHSQSKTTTSSAGDLRFKPDGKKLFITQQSGSMYIYDYSLSTDWDISTATQNPGYVRYSFYHEALKAMFFKPDGTKLYTSGQGDKIWEFTLED